jgi:hypothetical protein
MGFWNRKPSLHEVLSTALTQALAGVYEGQAKLLAAQTAFLTSMSELSARRAAQALGSRGGRRSAEKRAIRRATSSCPLCADPLRSDVTIAMISTHREHDRTRTHASPLPSSGEAVNGAGHTSPGDLAPET